MDFYLHDDPNLPSAWAPWFSHEYITYFSVQAIERLMALPPVPVKPNPHYGDRIWPVGPRHIDVYKESYQPHRQLNPLWSFDDKKRNGDFALEPPSGKTIEPWKALVIYSTEPDQYPDENLNLHKNQKITGGSRGWRHMQFRLMGTTFGIAPQSFGVHRNLARLALENANDYWGWRYLSRSAHYLADLGHPFHVKALPGSFLVKKFFKRHELLKISSAVHKSYEVYSERRFREGFQPFKQALLEGAREGQSTAGDIQDQLKSYIKRARKKHNRIFYFFLDQFGQELFNVFGQTDQNTPTATESQIHRCLADAARVIFKDVHRSGLDFLDRITAENLFAVGRMMGMLLGGFSSPKK